MPTHSDIDVETTAATINTGADTKVASLLLQADPTNDADILWGDANLQNMILAPGQLQPVPADYIEEVFVKSVSGTQKLSIAFVTR